MLTLMDGTRDHAALCEAMDCSSERLETELRHARPFGNAGRLGRTTGSRNPTPPRLVWRAPARPPGKQVALIGEGFRGGFEFFKVVILAGVAFFDGKARIAGLHTLGFGTCEGDERADLRGEHLRRAGFRGSQVPTGVGRERNGESRACGYRRYRGHLDPPAEPLKDRAGRVRAAPAWRCLWCGNPDRSWTGRQGA